MEMGLISWSLLMNISVLSNLEYGQNTPHTEMLFEKFYSRKWTHINPAKFAIENKTLWLCRAKDGVENKKASNIMWVLVKQIIAFVAFVCGYWYKSTRDSYWNT